MPTSTVNVAALKSLTEIVVRAGNAGAPHAREVFQQAYEDIDPAYPDAVGISTLFREGATLDELAREGAFPHKKISFTVIGRLVQELDSAGYELVLYTTPTPRLPDHHSLAVAVGGIVQQTLADSAADVLIRALTTVDNPYQGLKTIANWRPTMTKLRQVFADFARLEERAGLGLSVPLGREDRKPQLAELTSGERVLLVEPDNLYAEGTARSVDSGGQRYWYGVLDDMSAIHELGPIPLTSQAQE